MTNQDALSSELKTLLDDLKKEDIREIDIERVIGVALDITRVYDKEVTAHVNEYKILNNIKLSTPEKRKFRLYCLGLEQWDHSNYPTPTKPTIPQSKIEEALSILQVGIGRNRDAVIGTFRTRLDSSQNDVDFEGFHQFIDSFEKDKSQLLIIDLRDVDDISTEDIKHNISTKYDELANYHYAAVLFGEQTWSSIAEVAIHAENMKIEKSFKLFERTKGKKIEELLAFLRGNQNLNQSNDFTKLVSEYYEGIAYGFQFQDLFISRKDKTRILLFQKIELDDRVIPCPDCNSTKVRGNSYPKMLLRSFECHNPDCSSRSKIGRGKRFDYFSVKRNFLLKRNDPRNSLDSSLLKKYRKDIVENAQDCVQMLITFYSWADDRVIFVSKSRPDKSQPLFNRLVTYSNLEKSQGSHTNPLVKLLLGIQALIEVQQSKPKKKIEKPEYTLLSGNSTNLVAGIPDKLGAAITSPPYYNAREYSQWPTLLCYLVDMMISARSIFDRLNTGGYYFYNIGDIVGQDNIYVSSHMSNRRLMLGFYSILIFELVGFDTLDNLIWDKGEVQSKRNSSENAFPSYIKPINCYEHFLVFGKESANLEFSSSIFFIDSVKKINSKGINTFGHTAPFPIKLVEIPLQALSRDSGRILDPFLGSGTTVIACKIHGFKSVGIEFDDTYFELASNRISQHELDLNSDLFD